MKKKEPLDRLTRDVLAAEAAGMSYGNYKAAHPHTPDEDDEDEEEIVAPPAPVGPVKVRICEECGTEFTLGRQSEKKFCSDRCRTTHGQRLRNQRIKNQVGKPGVCIVCGKDFVVSWQRRKYCSTECFTVGQRRRQKALKKQYKEEAAKNGST